MIKVRMKPQSNDESTGWLARLRLLSKGYTASTRSGPFGTIIHRVKIGVLAIELKQGGSRAVSSEVDESTPLARSLIKDLISVGALFDIPEASAWTN